MAAESENLTKADKTLHIQKRNENGLTLRQQQAADLLALGESKTKAAAAVGVSRQQLHTWVQNVYFRSAVSKRHAEVWQESKERLRGLAVKAVDVIGNEIEGGNLKAAVELLKIVGLSNGKIALVAQPGKSVEDLLEIESAKYVDDYLSTLDKPSTTQEVLQREFGLRPEMIKNNLRRLQVIAKVPEDKAEELKPEEAGRQ